MSKAKFFKTTTFEKALKMGPRKFVKDYLFPAMRREHGNGFAMATWHRDTTQIGPEHLDDISFRPAPACNSVMCIGGTMQAITGKESESGLADILGLPLHAEDSVSDANTLFFAWTGGKGPWSGLSTAFIDAKTPQAKERIAEKAVMQAIRIGEKLKKEAK